MKEVLVFTSGCTISITLSDGYSGVLQLTFSDLQQQDYQVTFTKPGQSPANKTVTVFYDVMSSIELGKVAYYPVMKMIVDGGEIQGDSQVFVDKLEGEFRWFSIERFTKLLPPNVAAITVTVNPQIRVFVGV